MWAPPPWLQQPKACVILVQNTAADLCVFPSCATLQLTDVGTTSLARAAKGALALSRLNLSLNNTTDATLHALADALRFNTGVMQAAKGFHLISWAPDLQHSSIPL